MNFILQKRVWLAGASLLAIVLGSGDANAVVFSGPDSAQYVIPSTGYYEFKVAGADGGQSTFYFPPSAGAVVGGELFFDAGDILTIIAGGAGVGEVRDSYATAIQERKSNTTPRNQAQIVDSQCSA